MSNTDHRHRVAANLAAAIDATTVTQAEFCRRFGVSPSKLGNWLRGNHYPDPYVMSAFCEAEGVTMDWIYRGRRAGVMSAVAERLAAASGASLAAEPALALPAPARRGRPRGAKRENQTTRSTT